MTGCALSVSWASAAARRSSSTVLVPVVLSPRAFSASCVRLYWQVPSLVLIAPGFETCQLGRTGQLRMCPLHSRPTPLD
eukprot:1142896-Pelagomonas_calceolata.AAC.1